MGGLYFINENILKILRFDKNGAGWHSFVSSSYVFYVGKQFKSRKELHFLLSNVDKFFPGSAGTNF